MVAANLRFVKRRDKWAILLAAIAVLSLPPGPAAADESAQARAPAARAVTPAPAPAIAGVYSVEGGTAQVVVKNISGDIYFVSSSEGWEGVGILDGSTYRGVFRNLHGEGSSMGEQTIDWSDPKNPSMQATYTVRGKGQRAQRWHRLPDDGKPPAAKPPGDVGKAPGHRPEFGEFVYVEELPEVVTKVAPIYPDEQDRVHGTVLVQALVLEDGTVGDVRVVEGPAMLRDAAAACVRQWRFKPARTQGSPVAVWVAVPVRFPPQ